MRFTSDSCNTAKTMRCTKTAYILQCTDFLLQSAVNITAQFADMILYVATTMQFADVSFALLQILPDGKAPCNELMLHHAMQCTGASCRMLQIPSNFVADSTQLRDSNSKDQHVVHRYFYTEVLSQRHVFTQMFTHTHACLHKLFLHANTFMHKCFYTGMLLQTDARVLLHTDAFTQRCCYRGMLSHPFTHGFL